jgi:hypothetical protein
MSGEILGSGTPYQRELFNPNDTSPHFPDVLHKPQAASYSSAHKQRLSSLLQERKTENPMGDGKKQALRVGFDGRLKLEFHGANITSDAGLLVYRELDDALELTTRSGGLLDDWRTGKNTQHSLEALLCQRSIANWCGTQSRAEGISSGVRKRVLETRNGLIALSERIKCWSMKLHGPRWSQAHVKWEMSADGKRSFCYMYLRLSSELITVFTGGKGGKVCS